MVTNLLMILALMGSAPQDIRAVPQAAGLTPEQYYGEAEDPCAPADYSFDEYIGEGSEAVQE
jgi:hypothetical protein